MCIRDRDFPKPVHGLAIEPKRHGDEQRMWEILTKLVDEDPCLKVEHVATTNETIVYGLGELHLRVLLERLREVYRFEVNTRPPRIAYRETISANAEGHCRHKKQTGGAGQFGEVFLKVEHVATTNETIVYGLGELHLRVLLDRLREVHKFEVNTRPPRIAYRESVSAGAEGHHRHKKQTGGAGQFGEVFLRIEPLPRGSGFEFVDQVKGGTIPTQYIPAVEKGVREVLAHGAIAGYPVVDVRVIVYDGKHHSVDSKEIAFVTAGRKAFLDAILKAQPVVLEPIVAIEISAPDQAMGDITGDLSAKRGMVTGTANLATGTVLVKGQVPMSELSGYQSRLNALTAGQGRYTITLSHHEVVPPAVQQQLTSGFKARDDE